MTDGDRYVTKRRIDDTPLYDVFNTFLLLSSDIFARMMFWPLKSWTVLTGQTMPGTKQPDGM